MTEAIIIAITTPIVGLFSGYCAGMADSTAYDEKAHRMWEISMRAYEDVYGEEEYPPLANKALTHYHIGKPYDAWHIIRNCERYGGYLTALISGAYIGLSWWLIPMVVFHALAGWIGFNLGDRWKGSIWTQKLGAWINGE